jgi:hypothetical protein
MEMESEVAFCVQLITADLSRTIGRFREDLLSIWVYVTSWILPAYEKSGLLSTFDPALYVPRMQVDSAGVPVGPPVGGFVQAGNVIPQYDLANVPNVSKRILTSLDPNNFAPRVGFAYAVRDSLVMRGGYGIFYSDHRRPTSELRLTLRRCTRFAEVRRRDSPVRRSLLSSACRESVSGIGYRRSPGWTNI